MQQWWRVYAILGTLVGLTFALEGILGAPPTAFAVTGVVVGAVYPLIWLTGIARPPGRPRGRGPTGGHDRPPA